MNDEVHEILDRARRRVPTGFATIQELEQLEGGRNSLEAGGLFTFPQEPVIPLVDRPGFLLTACYRYVSSGPSDPHHQPGQQSDQTGKRYHIGSIFEITLNNEALYTMPFPAGGRYTDPEDERRAWAWSERKLSKANDLQLALMLRAIRPL